MGGGRKEVACGKCDMCSLFLNFDLTLVLPYFLTVWSQNLPEPWKCVRVVLAPQVCDQVQASHSSQHIAYSTPPAPFHHTRAGPDYSISCKAVTRKHELFAGIVISCQDAVEGIEGAVTCSPFFC